MADRFKPNASYIIQGNLLNIVWEEVCVPFLGQVRTPAKQKEVEARVGMVLSGAIEDETGASRIRR